MALPPSFLEDLRARTPLPAVIGRRVKLARAGRQWRGCCPFHGEKTPSFYVYDDHYHCFGCGAHGDAISFVMQSQGAGFMEAVQQLAAEAGLDVPAPSPAAAEAESRRADLTQVMARVATFFARRLLQPEGRRALDYLLGRGLQEETIRRFELGWAPARGALAPEMARDGIGEDQLIEAGLLRREEGRGEERLWEQFHERVMFPIRDRRGRVISFGGRTLGDGQPKYVNGPETSLFSKRRSLYALDAAREAARTGASVVVVEGYMDVIALHQAGFGGAVAPLGTALTQEQIESLWQLSPAPVLCFDGDAAGGRAAARAADLALPLLAPDRTLRIATVPAKHDPDSLVRTGGPAAFQAVLDTARPLSDALFDLVREGHVAAVTPEERAGLRKRLEDAAARIPDKALASEYRRVLLDRFYAGRRRPGSPAVPRVRPVPRSALRPDDAGSERLRILTAILLRHPVLVPDIEEAYAGLDMPPWLAGLRSEILCWAEGADTLDSQAVMDHLHGAGLAADVERALAAAPFPLPACAMPERGAGQELSARDATTRVMPADAESAWWHIFGFLNRPRLDEEVAAAQAAFAQAPDAQTERRLVALVEARNKLRLGETDGVE